MPGNLYQGIETELPPRFEIRTLEEKHIPWANAIVCHSNIFHSPVWAFAYPDNKCNRAYRAFETADYLIRHQIISGHSFGVFDKEYKCKRTESQATEGQLYWDAKSPSKDESGAEMLEQMDFPLVSVALSYDGINPLDTPSMSSAFPLVIDLMLKMTVPLIAVLPAFADVYVALLSEDKRDAASWTPTDKNQVLMRNATSSRHDIEGKHIMRKLANFVMRYANNEGFRGIQIECAHDRVTHVWTHPPEPFKADLVSAFNSWEYEAEKEDGSKWNPFGAAHQTMTKVYVHLKPEEKKTIAGSEEVPEQIGALG